MSARDEVHAALVRAGYGGHGADSLIARVRSEKDTRDRVGESTPHCDCYLAAGRYLARGEHDPECHIYSRPAEVVTRAMTAAERRLAEYGELVTSFGCGDARALYRLACEMRDELVKLRSGKDESEEQTERYAGWLVEIRNAVGGNDFPSLPEMVRALVADREGGAR
ncbi:hypothetical protein [Streptomyces decoyicus]